MVHKPKSIQYKVITGYLLLSVVAVISVWFVYREIMQLTGSNRLADENAKIIKVSGTIAALYSSEAIGRSAIISAKPVELKKYYRVTDTILLQLQALKKVADPTLAKKLEEVKRLVARKRNSITEIYKFHEAHPEDEYYTGSIQRIKMARDSVWKHTSTVKSTKTQNWDKLAQSLLTPQQYDSLSKLPMSYDTLTVAYEKVLRTMRDKKSNANSELNRKEQKLLVENRVISEQIQVILTAIEKEFVKKSYEEIKSTATSLKKTTKTLAWVGAGTLFLLIVLASVIIRDLGINQRYRRELEQLNTENQELLHSKGMLMATVTHDLQTPLGSILGFQELLKKSGVNTAQQEYLDNIKESAGYIVKLVNDLLDFSKLENNRISVEKIPANIKNTIDTTCSALLPMAEQKGIELWWDTEDNLDTGCLTDPYRIKQVLTNLVSNAIKFTHEGSVQVTGKVENNRIILAVIDTGIGIAPSKHGAVFKEFTQAHDGIEKKFGGTGLGLTISKRIIELLGGTISLESEEGNGTIFTINLPFVAATLPAPVANTEANTITPDIKDKNILVVDDDATQLRLMKELLENAGAKVVTELNSLSAIKLIEEQNFDTVITDLQMPIMDGFGLAESIRNHKDDAIKKIQIIALSGRRDIDEETLIKRGFDRCLTKPVNILQLTTLIAKQQSDNDFTSATSTQADKNTLKLYDLSSLIPFTQNDPESLKLIIDTFIVSTAENCRELSYAGSENNEDRIAKIAHKMIPMLLQMEVYSIADLLRPLEEKTIVLSDQEMIAYCNDICLKMENLCAKLQKETI